MGDIADFVNDQMADESCPPGDPLRGVRLASYSDKCPLCKAPLIEKYGRYGKFYGCTKFPLCKGKRSCR